MKKAADLKNMGRRDLEEELLKRTTQMISELYEELKIQTGEEWICSSVHNLKEKKVLVSLRSGKKSVHFSVQVGSSCRL